MPVLERIARLLALAESPNVHEAQAAMSAAQRLMLKHNLEADHALACGYGFRHLGEPTGRVSEAERMLANILGEHFFVEVHLGAGVAPARGQARQRARGLRHAGQPRDGRVRPRLPHAHRRAALARNIKRAHGIRGNRDRRTYLAGVMTGFREKLNAQRKQQQAAGLVWVGDGDLEKYYRRRHPHIRWTRHTGVQRNEAHAHGRAAGRNIVLHRAVHERVERGRLLPARRS